MYAVEAQHSYTICVVFNRTSTEQIPDKYRTTMDVSPLLERRKSMGMVFEGFWKDEAIIIMDIIIDADNNKERRTKQ